MDSECPYCGHHFDSATCPAEPDKRPQPQDMSVCIECGQLLVFNDDLTVRAATYFEVLGLEPNELEELMRVQTVIIQARHRMN